MTKLGAICAVTLCTACGNDAATTEEPIEPAEPSALERCVLAGGAIRELWSAGNQHGAVTSIAVSGPTIVLGSEDGSVKQWSVEAQGPSYGTPFVDETEVIVDALTFATDDIVLGVDRLGQLNEWRASDATPLGTTAVMEVALAAVGASPDGKLAAVAKADIGGLADIRVVDRITSTISPALETAMWAAHSLVFGPRDTLFTSGQEYAQAWIERRSASSPSVVADMWADTELRAGTMFAEPDSRVRAVAVDRNLSVLVAAAGSLDGFVAVFDPLDLAKGPTAFTNAAGHEPVGLALLPGSQLFVTAGREGALRVWRISGELVATLPIPEPVGLGRDGSGDTLYTAGPDGILRAFGCR